ncbi:MAG: hypothetical protein HYW77_01015 [Parcubacteria group bacterium]|nr:hypothetical protein [Parcubacteria group bacterium]
MLFEGSPSPTFEEEEKFGFNLSTKIYVHINSPLLGENGNKIEKKFGVLIHLLTGKHARFKLADQFRVYGSAANVIKFLSSYFQ